MPGTLPIDAVLFDLHFTLVDQGDANEWLTAGWRQAGLPSTPRETLGGPRTRQVVGLLDEVWSQARDVDPESRRDLDPAAHREVFCEVLRRDGVDGPLIDGLYDTLFDRWHAYDDAVPTMSALRAADIKVVVLSNIGVDARPMMQRTGLLTVTDAVVLSYELGIVKPDPAIFRHALDVVGVPADRALMVGDSRDDSGALTAGIRTLLLPRTAPPVHGLDAVSRLAGL